MNDFSATDYFRRKLDSLNAPKQESISQALRSKVADLQEYQQAVAANRALVDPGRSPEDLLRDAAVMAAKGAVGLPEAAVGLASLVSGGVAGKAVEDMGIRFKDAKEILDAEYSPAQQEANLRVQIADGFTETLDQAIQNPSTIVTSIGESLPQMVGGAAVARGLLAVGARTVGAGIAGPVMPGILARTVGQASAPVIAGAVGEGVLGAGAAAEQIRGETADGLLDAKQSLAAVGSGVGTAAFSLLGAKIAQRLGLPDIDTALASGSLKSPAGFVKALVGSGISEGFLEEMPQSAQEQMWQNYALDKPLMEGVGDASAMGLLSGLAMGNAAGGLSGLAGLVGQKADEVKKEADTAKARAAAQEAAIATGDVTALIDPKKPTYAPGQAIAALVGNSSLATATPEAKETNLKKAGEIVAGARKAQESAQADYDMVSPEAQQANLAALNAAKARRDAETDPVKKAEHQADVDLFTVPEVKATPEQIKNAKANLDLANKNLADATEGLTRFNEELASGSVDVKAAVATINTPVDEKDAVAVAARSAAATSVINLSMALSEELSTDDAEALIKNTSNGLTTTQRDFLRKFTAARVAANQMKDTNAVAKEIYYGGNGNEGIVQHRQKIAGALGSGNKTLADKAMAVLKNLEEDHRTKAELVAQALADHQATGKNTQVIRVGKAWQRNKGRLYMWGKGSTAEKNGAISIHMNTPDALVPSIKAEALAITTALAEMQAAYAIKFSSSPATQGAVNVPVVSQAPAPATPPTQLGVQQEGKDSGSAQPVVGSGAPAAAGSGTSEVGAAGVASAVPAAAPAPVAQSSEVKNSVDSQAAPAAVVTGEATDAAKVSNQSTESTGSKEEATSPESVEPTSEQPKGLTVLKEGKGAQETGTKLGAVYRSINKAVTFLTQRQTKVEKDSDISAVRPLVDVPNLLSQWNEDPSLVESFFPDTELSDEQSLALNTFRKFATQWAAGIKQNFIKGSLTNSKGKTKNADQLFRDPVQDFYNADGTMDENIVTAVTRAAYSWLVNSTMAPALKLPEDILEMHGLDEEDTITGQGIGTLKRMAAFEDAAINSIGRSVVTSLGLKAKPGAPQDYLGKVAAAFGVHALELLRREGLIEIVTVRANELEEFMPSMVATPIGKYKDGAPMYAYYSYVKIVRDDATLKPVGDGKTIIESVKGSQGVLDRLFDSEHIPMEATTEPVKFKQQFAKGTKQTLSTKLRRILAAANKQENRIIPDMWNALQVLGDSVILKAAGWKDTSLGKVQANNVEAVEAQNNNLENQLQLMVDLIDPANLKQAFYANFEAWKNFRVGVTTRNMNLQTSKIHRFMFARPDWESTIRMDDAAKVDSFLVAVAQALGIKVDQQSNAETLVKLEAKLSSETDKTVELVRALNKAIKDPANSALTDAQKADIAALASDAEGMQTLQALVAYGRYLEAQDAGAASFTATMLVGVDGKTNGPILSHLALGAAATVDAMFAMMNRGGMYSLASKVKNFSEWFGDKQARNLDLYEDLSRAILSKLNARTPGLASIEVITKNLLNRETGKVTSAGRKIVKTPLTSFAFGSSVEKSLENMQNAFVEAVFSRIEDLATGADPRLKRQDLIRSINEMFSMGGLPDSELISPDETIDELMAWEIEPFQAKALKVAFDEVLGKTVKKTMKSYFSEFIKRRNGVNESIQASFAIYQAIYQDLRTKELARLIEAGEIAYTEVSPKGKDGKADTSAPKIKIPLHDMTVAQEAALRKKVEAILPQAHTAYTQGADGLGSGLMMAKQSKNLGNDPMYAIEVQMGVAFTDADGNESVQIKSRGMQESEYSPGVAGLPYLMHSTDSHIMHDSIEGTQSLNVHDEAGNAADKVEATAQRINQSTWTTMLRFSPANEAYEMLERAVMNSWDMVQSGNVSPEALAALESIIQNLLTDKQKVDLSYKQMVGQALINAKAQAHQANLIRLETMSLMGSVDQYTWEGGEYQVTQDDRDEAAALLEKARKEDGGLSNDVLVAAKELGIAIHEAGTAEPSAEAADFESDPVDEESPFGTVGTPVKASNPQLLSFFEQNPEPTGAQVAKYLYDMMEKGSYTRLLVGMLRKAMPADIKVILVRKDTVLPESKMPRKEDQGKAFGWKTGNEVYILSDDFVNTGLQTPEVLLHELVHAVLQHVMASPRGAEKAMIAALTDLMEQAKAYAQDKGITKFDAALNDLDEFVAYGMTRKSFQEFLAQVTVTTPSTGLVNGFKEFVDRLVGLLFARIKKTQTQEAQASTALAGLIENVTGLLESATVEQAGVRDSTGLPAKSMTRDTRVLTISEDREGFKLVDTTTGEWIEVGHPLEDEITGLIRTRKDAEVVLRAWDSRTIRSLSMAMPANPVGAVNNFTTLDIHNALNAGSVTPEFDAKLRNVLGGIVEKLYGPFQVLKPGWMKNQALTAVDVWHKALATGNAPFAGSAIAAPFIMSEREAHAMEQVEATVRIALERDETTATSARHELNTLFTEAMSIIKPTDFASVDQYNFLFKVETGANGRSDHLARFAAFGLANEQVNKLLRVNTQGTAKKQGKTIMEKLGIFWEGVLEFFHEKVTSTYAGQKADAKLLRLVDQLIDIEAKKRSSLARRAGAFNLTAPIEAGAKKLVEAGIRKVSDIAGSQLVRNNSSSVVKAVGSVVRIVANNQVDAFMEEVKQFRAQQWKDRLGFVAGTLNYAMGGDKVQEALLRERKVLEGERKDLITRISKMTRQAFVNGGKDMSKAAKNSITQVFMRTGAFVLKGPYNMTQLENLVGDKAARNAEIASLEAQLTGLGNMRNSVINQAKALGYFKVTGRNKAKVLMMNAHNIARLYGTPYRNRVTEAQAQQREPVVEKLVALYALSYVPPAELNIAKRVLQTENARPASEGNGVEFVLEMHRRMDKESRDRLFQGQEALMTHGYTQEIYSPHIEIQTADDVTGQELINKGYKKGAAVEIDPAHPDQTRKHLYVLDGGGLMPHLTGNLAYDGKRSKGARQHSGYMNINTADGLANASLQADIMHGKQNAMNNASNWDPSQEKHTYMAPIVNPQGEIVNWRYLMHDSTKDTILQRENQFDLVLGTLAGSIFGKDTVTDTNTRVFQAMKDQYDAEKARKSAAYVLVGPKSPDPELREMWAKLPDDSKAAARAIWGRDGMFVRNDQRDIIFGYRKLSLANAIRSTQDRRKDDADRIARGMAPIGSQGLVDDFENAMAKFFTVAVEHALVLHARTKGHPDPEKYGERAAVVISRGERAWQEIVGETKDLLVIKTVTVMMGNLKSNMSLLILSGVPIKDIVNSHLVAWRGATSYQRDSDELDRLKTLIDIGQTNGKDAQIKIQIARLEDALARNPVRELIEAGLMPTIVEDAAEDVDPYSYKSALTEKVDTLTSKLHPGVKTTLKNVYMTKDTAPYQALRRVTQLSDFMARYTQYQHLTTRQVDPLSKEDAIQQSSEDFINYDVPMHRSMQYLDDMGIFPFMKYFLRVQKVLMRLTKDHPARVFSAVLLGQFLDFGPIVLDSSWVAKIGNNPIHWGALQYPGALDELATVNSALSLVGAGGSDWAPQ